MIQTTQDSRKPCPIANLSTTNRKWTVRVSNLGCQTIMPAANRLGHDAALNSEINLRYEDRFCSEPHRQRCLRALENLLG